MCEPGPASTVDKYSLRNISSAGDRGSILAVGFSFQSRINSQIIWLTEISNNADERHSRNLQSEGCCDNNSLRKRERSLNKLVL